MEDVYQLEEANRVENRYLDSSESELDDEELDFDF